MNLILESTLNQARAYFKKSLPPVDFVPKEERKSKDIGLNLQTDYVGYLKEYTTFKLIETLCKQPVKIENISKKGGNNLDIMYLMYYLYRVEGLSSFIIEENRELHEKVNDDIEQLRDLDDIIDNDFKKFTIDKGFIEKYSKSDYRNSIEYYLSHIIINNNFITLLPLGNPAQLTPKTLERWRRSTTENSNEKYTISEYLFDWLISWLPYRIESNKWLKNFPSNIRQAIKRDYMDTFISYVRSLKKLPYSKQDEIWSTYFIQHEGDRGIIRRFKKPSDFMDDFKNRIRNAGKGLGEFLLRMEKLGKQVSTVYSKDSLYILDVKSYIASNKLAADSTSWCISTYETYWNQYVTIDNKQYFIMDFDRSDDISRIGVTIRPDGTFYTAHTKSDNYISQEKVISHMKSEYNIDIMKYLDPISKEEYKIIKETRDFKRNLADKVERMLGILKVRGKIKESDLVKEFYDLVNSDHYDHMNSQISNLGSMFLTLGDFENFENLINRGLENITVQKIIYLYNRDQIDLIFRIINKIDFNTSIDLNIIFGLFFDGSDIEIYFKLFNIVKKLYYEIDGKTIYSKYGVLNHLLETPDNNLEILKTHINNISEKERKKFINSYSDNYGNTLIDSIIGKHINQYKKIEFPKETINYLLEFNPSSKNPSVLAFAYKEKFIEPIVGIDKDQYKILLIQLIENKTVNIVDIKFIEEKINSLKFLSGIESLNDLYDQIKGNEDRCGEIFDYLMEKDIDISDFKTHGYWNPIEPIISKIIPLYDGDRLKEVLNKIKRDNLIGEFAKVLFNKYIGTGTTEGYLDSLEIDEDDYGAIDDIKRIVYDILNDEKSDENAKKIKEIIGINKKGKYKIVTTSALSQINNKYPELYNKRKINNKGDLDRTIRTNNQNLIKDVFTEENIKTYKNDLLSDRDLLLYIEKDNIETLINYEFIFSNDQIDRLISNPKLTTHKKMVVLMDHDINLYYFNIIDKYFNDYDNSKSLILSVIDGGDIDSVKYFMNEWFMERDISKWGIKSEHYWRRVNHETLFISMLTSTSEILNFILDECDYLSKMNDYLKRSQENKSKKEGDDYSYNDDIRLYSWGSNNKKFPMTIGKLQKISEMINSKYDYIKFNINVDQIINQIDSVEAIDYLLSEIKDSRGDLTNPTYLLKQVASASYGNSRYISKSRTWFMPQVDIMKRLYEKGADVQQVYDHYKRSRDLSNVSREFLKDTIKEINKAEKLRVRNTAKNEIFSFEEFKYSNI